LADPYNDPHGLGAYNYVDDGIGCDGDMVALRGSGMSSASELHPSPPVADLDRPPGIGCERG
jgi:hypothetical protein